MTAFEIDYGFCRILGEQAFADESSFRLISGDALKTLPSLLASEGAPDRLCGNLPYNVGSVAIAKVLESDYRPRVMVFTLQKEVVDRLCAAPQSKDWSSFSMLAQMDYEVKPAFSINSGAFYPPPNVTSSTVVFTLRPQSLVSPHLRSIFLLVIRDLFAQRRKTVKNNLLSGKIAAKVGKNGVDEVLARSHIDPSKRAEALLWSDFLSLSESLFGYQAT